MWGHTNTRKSHKIKNISTWLCWYYIQLYYQLWYVFHVREKFYIGLLFPSIFRNIRGVWVIDIISLSFVTCIWVHGWNTPPDCYFCFILHYYVFVFETFGLDYISNYLGLTSLVPHHKPIYWVWKRYFRRYPMLILLFIILVLDQDRKIHLHHNILVQHYYLLLTYIRNQNVSVNSAV